MIPEKSYSLAVAQLATLKVCDAFYKTLNVITVSQYISKNSDATVHVLANEFHSTSSPLGAIEKTIPTA